MNNNLKIFSHGNISVRTLTDEHSNIWFVARDVALALDYSLAGSMQSMFAHVPDIWKGSRRIATPGGEQDVLCLTEQVLYFFLGRSDKPKALPYQMWIAGEVVPMIRQTGFYATPETAQRILEDPDTFINVLKAYKEQKARNAQLEVQALGYSADSNLAILFANVPAIWKGVKPFHTPGGEQEMLCLNVSLIKDFEHC